MEPAGWCRRPPSAARDGSAHEEAARERHAEMYYRYSLPGGLTILPGLQLSDRRGDGSGLDLAVGIRFSMGI